MSAGHSLPGTGEWRVAALLTWPQVPAPYPRLPPWPHGVPQAGEQGQGGWSRARSALLLGSRDLPTHRAHATLPSQNCAKNRPVPGPQDTKARESQELPRSPSRLGLCGDQAQVPARSSLVAGHACVPLGQGRDGAPAMWWHCSSEGPAQHVSLNSPAVPPAAPAKELLRQMKSEEVSVHEPRQSRDLGPDCPGRGAALVAPLLLHTTGTWDMGRGHLSLPSLPPVHHHPNSWPPSRLHLRSTPALLPASRHTCPGPRWPPHLPAPSWVARAVEDPTQVPPSSWTTPSRAGPPETSAPLQWTGSAQPARRHLGRLAKLEQWWRSPRAAGTGSPISMAVAGPSRGTLMEGFRDHKEPGVEWTFPGVMST